MMHLALWWMLVSSDVTTGGTSTATPALKCHYFVKDHQAIAKNTTKTASHFYESLSNNLTSRLDNRSLVHVKGLALSNGWINYPTDLFLNGSNITSSFSWSTSWSKLLPELTSKMVLQVVEQVREETKYGSINSDAILSIDYEPKYRPSWNFTIGEGAAYETQPAWTALLHQVHNKQLFVCLFVRSDMDTFWLAGLAGKAATAAVAAVAAAAAAAATKRGAGTR